MADRVWLTDHLSDAVLSMGRATNEALDHLMKHAMTLAPLLPLIAAGIVRFRSPWIPTCGQCSAEFEDEVDFKIERDKDGGYIARTGKSFDPPLFFRSMGARPDGIPSSREFAKSTVADQIRSSLWTAREASMTGGSLLTNSRIALAGLLQREGRLPDRGALLLFDKERELSVPWVSDLNAAQILQLREEAALALPAFRECLTRAMARSDAHPEGRSSDEVISELREQAAEVWAELSAKRQHSARYWKVSYGLLGLALSAYGVASDQIIPGVGGILPVLQLLISHKVGYEAELAKPTTRPGYVLVKAKEILAHAH
jgi:hypothetical protein